MFRSGNGSICTVFGCGEIFYAHYSRWLISLFNHFIFCDPLLSQPKAVEKLKLLFENSPEKQFKILHNSQELAINKSNAVFIFTNHKSHFQLIKQSLGASLIFVEKPCVLNTRSWEEVISQTNRANTTFWPAYHQFYTSFAADAKHDFLINNNIDEIAKIEIEFFASSLPIRSWGKSYTSQTLAGGGVFLDLGPHVFSLLAILVKDISRHQIIYDKVNAIYASDNSELDTEINFQGRIKNCEISARIGYINSNQKGIRSFRIRSNNSSKTIESINGELILNKRPLEKANYTNLAFKNMVSDSLKFINPYYIKHIPWNIQSVESFYRKLGIKNFTDSR